ncbi:MAG: hydantoinase/oxoprolinase N-terminal domain-containing protein [Terriglobales bacterium]
MRVAVDTGGTFTDCVFISKGDLQILKVFSTLVNPAQAILARPATMVFPAFTPT